MRTIGHFIGGKRVEGTSGRFADVYNPATGPELGARLPKPSSSTPISWASETKSLACS